MQLSVSRHLALRQFDQGALVLNHFQIGAAGQLQCSRDPRDPQGVRQIVGQ